MRTQVDQYHFKLYVRERSDSYLEVHSQLAELCSRHLPGRHSLTLLDLAALGDQGDNYRLATSGPGVLGRLPQPILELLEEIAFDKRFFIKVERAQ